MPTISIKISSSFCWSLLRLPKFESPVLERLQAINDMNESQRVIWEYFVKLTITAYYSSWRIYSSRCHPIHSFSYLTTWHSHKTYHVSWLVSPLGPYLAMVCEQMWQQPRCCVGNGQWNRAQGLTSSWPRPSALVELWRHWSARVDCWWRWAPEESTSFWWVQVLNFSFTLVWFVRLFYGRQHSFRPLLLASYVAT